MGYEPWDKVAKFFRRPHETIVYCTAKYNDDGELVPLTRLSHQKQGW